MATDRKKLVAYADTEITTKLAEFGLEQWQLDDGWIRRKYTTENWPTTLALIGAVGFIAEAAWHHPDFAVSWRTVWVKLRTHSVKGITDRDFALARRIEDIALWKPLPESPFDPNPNEWIKG